MSLSRIGIGLFIFYFLALPGFTRTEPRLLEYDLDTVTDFVTFEPKSKQNFIKLRVKGLDSTTIGSVLLENDGINNKYLRILTNDNQTVPDTGIVDFNLRVSAVRVNPQPTTLYLRPFALADGLEGLTIPLRIFVPDDQFSPNGNCILIFSPECYRIDFEGPDDQQETYHVFTGSSCSVYQKFNQVDLSLCGVDANGQPLN